MGSITYRLVVWEERTGFISYGYEIVALVVNNWAVVGLRVNLIHNRVDRVPVFYELKRETIKRFNQSINQEIAQIKLDKVKLTNVI